MKVNELRIGNYLLSTYKPFGYAQGSSYSQVTAQMILTIANNEKPNSFKLSGIPLTPEILEKAGFEIDEDKGFVREDDLRYPVYSSQLDIIHIRGQFFLWVEIDEDAFYNFRMREITNLHQLQNLYYALTGSELPITL